MAENWGKTLSRIREEKKKQFVVKFLQNESFNFILVLRLLEDKLVTNFTVLKRKGACESLYVCVSARTCVCLSEGKETIYT